jgi:sugar phosphate permease
LFWFIEGTTSPNDVMLMQAILAFIGSGVSASCCLMSTFFPTKERYSGYSFGWALGSIFFAGFTPLLSLLLVKWTGNETAPAFILMFCGFLGIVALTTSKKRYDEREDIEALPKFVNWPKPMRTA